MEYVCQLSLGCVDQISTVLEWVGAYSPDFVDCKLSDLQEHLKEYVILHDDEMNYDFLDRRCNYLQNEDMLCGPYTIYDFGTGKTTHVVY